MLLLPLKTLCDYAVATPSTRNMIEGERVINSGFIIVCGTTNKVADQIHLFSLCLGTSGLASEPHTITGKLAIQCDNNNESEIDKKVLVTVMDCSCKAGTSHCYKHIVAKLLYCNRKDLNSLQTLSSTDTKCLWKFYKQPVLELYEALPLRTFCCVKVDRLPPLPASALYELRCNFIKCDSETAIAKHSNRKRKSIITNDQRSVLPPKVLCASNDNHNNIKRNIQNNKNSLQLDSTNKKLNSENVKKSTEETVFISNSVDNFLPQLIDNAEKSKSVKALSEIQLPLKSCCQSVFDKTIKCTNVIKAAEETFSNKCTWKNQRQYRITGSRCYNVFTYSKGNWLDKGRKYFWPKEVSTPAMRHGIKYEPVAREEYRSQTNQCVRECGLIISKDEPWMAYSPDGIIKTLDGSIKLLEIKYHMDLLDTTNESLVKKCKYLKLVNNDLQFKKKHAYYGQIQFGMALLNVNSCDFVIYSNVSNTIKIITVHFDEVYANNLLNVLKTNYFKEMLHVICSFSQRENTNSANSVQNNEALKV